MTDSEKKGFSLEIGIGRDIKRDLSNSKWPLSIREAIANFDALALYEAVKQTQKSRVSGLDEYE